MGAVDVIAPNFKQRLSGVTSTIIQLVPAQMKTIGIATIGPGLPDSLPHIRWTQIPSLWRRPRSGRKRIWHARRNVEMLGGLVLRTLGAPVKLVFTSAAQRSHRAWTKFLIRRMDAVIATSSKAAAFLDVPHTVVMHGVDTERFSPPSDKSDAVRAVGLDPSLRYVGCFGRIRHQKGTDIFVDAMIALLPKYPQWSAVMTGRTTVEHQGFQRELEDRIGAAKLSDRIRFVGEQPDVVPWYKALSLFVAPQRWEGFGLTPLEAMSTGVPVVAADAGVFSELISVGKTGALVPVDDLEAIKAAIEPYLADNDLAERQGRTARIEVSANRGIENEAQQVGAVYARVWDAAA